MFPDLAPELQVVTGNRQEAAWVTLFKARVAGIYFQFNCTWHVVNTKKSINATGLPVGYVRITEPRLRTKVLNPGAPQVRIASFKVSSLLAHPHLPYKLF